MKLSHIKKEIKGVFKLPKKRYYLGRLWHGCPYFYPRGFNDVVITLRKLKLTPQEELDKFTEYSKEWIQHYKKFSNIPTVQRAPHWVKKVFGNYYWIEMGTPIRIYWHGMGWKDKYATPRFEWCPSFYILFFKWQFCIWWGAPDGNDDKYYEMIIWYLEYCDKDIVKSVESWGWIDYKTKLSTWNKDYLL